MVVHAGCDKQESLTCGGLCGKQHCRPTQSYCSDHRSDSQIFVENHDFCLCHLHSASPLRDPRRNIAITFGTEKLEWTTLFTFRQNWNEIQAFTNTEWYGYPTVKKIYGEDIFIRFDRIHERDGRTDGQTVTPHDGISRAMYSIAREK